MIVVDSSILAKFVLRELLEKVARVERLGRELFALKR